MVDLSAIRWKPPRITMINNKQTTSHTRPFFAAPTAVYLCKKAMRPTIGVIVTVKVKVAQAVARK